MLKKAIPKEVDLGSLKRFMVREKVEFMPSWQKSLKSTT